MVLDLHPIGSSRAPSLCLLSQLACAIAWKERSPSRNCPRRRAARDDWALTSSALHPLPGIAAIAVENPLWAVSTGPDVGQALGFCSARKERSPPRRPTALRLDQSTSEESAPIGTFWDSRGATSVGCQAR